MADEEMLQDFLLDMDFDELIPVDNFFDSYVGALSKDVANPGQMGVPAPPLPTAAAIDRVYDDPNVSASARGGIPMQPGIHDPSPGMWASGAPPPMAGLPQPSPSPLDVMADTANTIGGSQMNTGDRFLPAQPGLDVGDGMINGNAGFQELPETSASVEHPSPTMRDSKTRVSRGQTKTERQQMLNKAAQRRYRERKKAKADELKHAVSSLQDKVQELSMVYAEKNELQDRVNALEKELALKEAKLASFEQQQQDVTSGGGDVARGVCFGENDQNSLESNMTDFGNQFSHEVSKMKSWLGDHGFLSPDGEDVRKTLACSDLSPGQVDELRELGQQCYSSCLRCLSLYTDVDVAQLLSSTLNSKQAQFSGDATEWHHLVETLSLSDKVREDALQLREKYMNKLEELFHTRQCLNLEAVKVLLPQEVGGLSGAGKDWKEGPNFFMRYRHAYDTANVLRRLRNNLAEEQKALAELDYLVYVKLLDPVQLSRCILASFPQHCDVVSLLNAIHASHEGKK